MLSKHSFGNSSELILTDEFVPTKLEVGEAKGFTHLQPAEAQTIDRLHVTTF